MADRAPSRIHFLIKGQKVNIFVLAANGEGGRCISIVNPKKGVEQSAAFTSFSSHVMHPMSGKFQPACSTGSEHWGAPPIFDIFDFVYGQHLKIRSVPGP